MLDYRLCFNITILVYSVEHEWMIACVSFGLMPLQGFMLRVALERSSVPNRGLAEVSGIMWPTVTRLVDGLIVKSLVER